MATHTSTTHNDIEFYEDRLKNVDLIWCNQIITLIKNNFKNFCNIDPLCISLDDYYLTKKQRNYLSKRIHPLLETRGVPGTHATEKITKTIQLFDKKK